MCGKSTVRNRFLKSFTEGTSKGPVKNNSHHSKEGKRKIKLLVLSNIYRCDLSCQNLYCFNENALLAIRKQPINHLKLL